MEFLVIRRDGVDLPRLLDLRLDRIDVQIDEGGVTKASGGYSVFSPFGPCCTVRNGARSRKR